MSGSSSGSEVLSASNAPAVLAAAAAAGLSVQPGSTITIANPAKLQKEKEELRRINRAWNAKAEDEKKKVQKNSEVLHCCFVDSTPSLT